MDHPLRLQPPMKEYLTRLYELIKFCKLQHYENRAICRRQQKPNQQERPGQQKRYGVHLLTVIDFLLFEVIYQQDYNSLIMRNNSQRPYLPHSQHLHPIQRSALVRQKQMTGTAIQTQPLMIKTHLSPIQNLEMMRKDSAKVKIQFNYTPSTPKFGEDENLSAKTGNSSPRTNLSPQQSIPDKVLRNSSTDALLNAVEQKHLSSLIQPPQSSIPILGQHKINLHLVQDRNEAKSNTLNNKYQVITEVLPILEVSRHERDEEMISLKRELNETRSLNNQLRTEVLRWQKKFEQIEENHRSKTEELAQEIKELRIELQKAQNDKLLAQVSEAELQKKIKKMTEENGQREKLEKVRDDYLLYSFHGKKQRVYQNNISRQAYIQLFTNQPQ